MPLFGWRLIIPQAEKSVSIIVICQQCTPSNIYLSSNLVKTDVMWSSSGGKKVKQPLVRANKKPKENVIYYLFIIMVKSPFIFNYCVKKKNGSKCSSKIR